MSSFEKCSHKFFSATILLKLSRETCAISEISSALTYRCSEENWLLTPRIKGEDSEFKQYHRHDDAAQRCRVTAKNRGEHHYCDTE